MLLEVWQDSISMSSTLEPDLGSFASWWAASVDIWVWEDFLTYRWLWLRKKLEKQEKKLPRVLIPSQNARLLPAVCAPNRLQLRPLKRQPKPI